MKFVFLTCLFFSILLFNENNQATASQSTSVDSTVEVVKPLIVGGELASEGDWPWVAGLVHTYTEIQTFLSVAGVDYETESFLYGALGEASAVMVDCGIGDYQCNLASGKICLIERGEIDFSVKVNNCQAGGGIGAIIYNNVLGNIGGTLGADFNGNIPAIIINKTDGETLLSQLDQTATLTVDIPKNINPVVNCGASFIGNKWLITAAHCVDDTPTDFLKAIVGAYDLNDIDDFKAIKSIFIHPDYNVGTDFDNDIALIELVTPIIHSSVKLMNDADTRSAALNNSLATVIGWGNTVAYGPEDPLPSSTQPNQLLQVELPLLSNEQCKETLVQAHQTLSNTTYSIEQVGISDNMICALDSNGGKGSCQGDSGGPLLINTNEGWQQIGIVSHGIGCGEAGFPDVYTRVSKFTDWITSITQGVSFESGYDFPITRQYQAQTQLLTVTNNSNFTETLTFSLLSDNSSNSGFSISNNSCTTLAAKESCEISVSFDAQNVGQHTTQIVINTNDSLNSTSGVTITAQAIATNTSIESQLTSDTTDFLWFSGGDQPWQLANSAIQSGLLTDEQQSSVLLTFTGEGSLSFEWAVSSESPSLATDSPFDALYLFIDGELINFIAGEVPYTLVTVSDLSAGEHQVLWLYQKNGKISEGEDKGYLKNVKFTPTIETDDITSASETNDDNEANSSGSGGGAIHSTLLLLFLALALRRCRRR